MKNSFFKAKSILLIGVLAISYSCATEESLEVQQIEGISNASTQLNSVIQAEDFDNQSGVQIVNNSRVGFIQDGDWIRFDDFDYDGANSISIQAGTRTSGGTIEVRTGSPTGGDLLGTVNITNTGNFNNFRTFTANINDNSSNSDLYLTFTGGNGFLLDVDSFTINSGSTPTNPDDDDDSNDDGDNGNNDNDNDDGNNNSGSGGSAEDIVGGRDDWKLNGYTGNFRLGSDDNGLDYADDASLANSTFFFEQDGYAVFRSYAGNPTSGGSSNSRSELREQIDGGDGFWDGTINTERSMKWRVKVDNLPPSGNLCFGQIHERDDDFDDVIRVQAQGDGGQSSGSINLRIQGYVVEETDDDTRNLDFDMRMDTEYFFELTMRNSVVRLYELNNSGNRVRTLFTSVDIGDADENYFKAGAYLQTTRENQFGSNDFGQISIRDISVSPND